MNECVCCVCVRACVRARLRVCALEEICFDCLGSLLCNGLCDPIIEIANKTL